MRKVILFALVGIALFVASYGVYETQSRDNTLSDILLANVEALTALEGDNCHYINGVTGIDKEKFWAWETLHHYYDCCAIQIDGYSYDEKCK